MNNIGLAGYYQFVKHRVDADGNVIEGTSEIVLPWFGNLITNYGLDQLGANWNDQLAYCRLGTGNTAPAFTDTNLVAQVGSTTTVGLGQTQGTAVDSSYLYRRTSRRFAAGSVSGVNLAEVGMSFAASGANLFSRALLKDTGGTPTTITLASDEVLDVIYELREYITNADVVVNATIDGVSTTVTMRPHAWPTGTAWTGKAGNIGKGILPYYMRDSTTTLGTIETQPTAATQLNNAGSGNANPVPWDAYVNGTYSRGATLNLTLTVGNYATGVGAIQVTNDGSWWTDNMPPSAWSWGFNPKLNKTSSRTAQVKFGFTWGRYTP